MLKYNQQYTQRVITLDENESERIDTTGGVAETLLMPACPVIETGLPGDLSEMFAD